MKLIKNSVEYSDIGVLIFYNLLELTIDLV